MAESFAFSHNEEMITLNEPQIWTALGILAAALVGVITVMTQFMLRSFHSLTNHFDTLFTSLRSELKADISGLRTEMVLRFEQVDRRFQEVDRRFEQVDQRFEQVDRRFVHLETQVENLERDVQAISKRVFPE